MTRLLDCCNLLSILKCAKDVVKIQIIYIDLQIVVFIQNA